MNWGFRGPGNRFLELPPGDTAEVSPPGRARLIYNEGAGEIQASQNGGAYASLAGTFGATDIDSYILSGSLEDNRGVAGGQTAMQSTFPYYGTPLGTTWSITNMWIMSTETLPIDGTNFILVRALYGDGTGSATFQGPGVSSQTVEFPAGELVTVPLTNVTDLSNSNAFVGAMLTGGGFFPETRIYFFIQISVSIGGGGGG